MLCDRCKKNPASIYLSQSINGHKTELHLCQECAVEMGAGTFTVGPQFTFPQFLAGLLDQEFGLSHGSSDSAGELTCPSCGLTYDKFRQAGQFGCSHCYETFEPYMDALLKRVQGGTEHTGKIPGRQGGPLTMERTIENLRRQLQEAITREEYERAAELRDQIREMEQKAKASQ